MSCLYCGQSYCECEQDKDAYVCQVAKGVFHVQVSTAAYARGWRDKVVVAETMDQALEKYKAEGKTK